MPQLLSKVKANATVTLSPDSLADKPELAILVASVIGRWSNIEHEINNLAAQVLGADAAPAIAMFNVLQAQKVRMLAIDAAAKTAFGSSSEQYHVLNAAIRAAASVQNDRNRLAHWIWGSAPELPDALLLANPIVLRSQEVERTKYHADPFAHVSLPWDRVVRMYQFDTSKIYVYGKSDMHRSQRDLTEIGKIFFHLKLYFRPIIPANLPLPDHFAKDGRGTSAHALRELSKISIFHEALARSKAKAPKDQDSDPPEQL